MKTKWLVLEDDEAVHVLPETDIKPHGYPKGNKAELADINCPCKPKITFDGRKPMVVHNSFEDTKLINKSMAMLIKDAKKPKQGTFCLRCGIDKDFIKKEKVGCSVWGKSYTKHLYK